MNLTSEHLLDCAPETAWAMLTDPAVLQACIPGCQSLTQTGPNAYDAVVGIKVGPIKASFSGSVELTDLVVPVSCRIMGRGNSVVAGAVEGGAAVTLTPEGAQTRLAYHAEAKIAGKLAQLGARLIDATARKLAAEFFERLSARIAQTQQQPEH